MLFLPRQFNKTIKRNPERLNRLLNFEDRTDSKYFLILYLIFDLRHPDKVEKPIPIMDQSLGDDHSNKCSDISIQYAINIFFC